jgi:hypothetical protein
MTGLPEHSSAVSALLAALAPPPSRGSEAGGMFSDEEINEILGAGAQHQAPTAERLRAMLNTDLIKRCVECSAELDLPAPRVGKPTETWRCLACHAVCVTGLTGESVSRPGIAQKAHSSERLPLPQFAASQPAQLRRLVERLTAAGYLDDERRTKPRYAVSLPALGVPLNEARLVVGPPIRLTTRDVSLDGLSAFSETKLTTSLMLVDLTLGGFMGWQVAVRVVRQKTTGFLHEFGAEFVAE